jgi:hypothetical protein
MQTCAAIAVAAAMLAAGTAEAQDRSSAARAAFERDFCHELRRLVRESPDFEGIDKAKPAPPRLGFAPGACSSNGPSERYPASWRCHQSLAPPHLEFSNLVEKTAACLPDAQRLEAEYPREALFETERVRIRIFESGGARAKVGRIVDYRVESRR